MPDTAPADTADRPADTAAPPAPDRPAGPGGRPAAAPERPADPADGPAPRGGSRPRLPLPASVRRAPRRLAALRPPGPGGGTRRWRARWHGRPPAWWPVGLCALLGLALGGAWGLLSTPRYAATSYVVVVPGEGSDPAAALGFAQAYGRIATSGAVLRDARQDAGAPTGVLGASVRSATSPDAPMIEITGTATRPAHAAERANAVADALAASGNAAAESTGVRLVRFARALPPGSPSSPSAPLSAAVGISAGALVGGLFTLVRPRAAPRAPAQPARPSASACAPGPGPVPEPTAPAADGSREAPGSVPAAEAHGTSGADTPVPARTGTGAAERGAPPGAGSPERSGDGAARRNTAKAPDASPGASPGKASGRATAAQRGGRTQRGGRAQRKESAR
ncbi:hypothetical protein WDH52_14275 [Streptomyces sp. TRM70308]|uniref:hypothetical protein n=1 Tax=Streptomyces sp. TRM70308 TaxID=3131932 RepID=UPI003D024BDE